MSQIDVAGPSSSGDAWGMRYPGLTMQTTGRNTVKEFTGMWPLKPDADLEALQQVLVPGVLVDAIVVAPEQMQTTQTEYEPAISGELFRPLDSFEVPEFGISKVIARRVARELAYGDAVNIGFGVSANVPRILIEEGCHGAVT